VSIQATSFLSTTALVLSMLGLTAARAPGVDLPGKPAVLWTAEDANGKVFDGKGTAVVLPDAYKEYNPTDGSGPRDSRTSQASSISIIHPGRDAGTCRFPPVTPSENCGPCSSAKGRSMWG